MKESYKEDLANHFGFELYADGGNVMGVATTATFWGHTPFRCRPRPPVYPSALLRPYSARDKDFHTARDKRNARGLMINDFPHNSCVTLISRGVIGLFPAYS
ncbi:hypothetical protein SH449x_003111 [Pirellulaceae bacterium SH449]